MQLLKRISFLRKFNPLSFWNAVSALSVGLLGALGGIVATIFYEWWKFPGAWILIAVGAIAVVTGVNSQRDKTSVKWGTSYYLGVLLASMRDEHQLEFRKFKKETHYQDVHALTSKLEKHNEYGFDWVAEITATAQRMQESMNEDDVSTGFDICPNLLMPAALGIGAQLYFPHDVEYIEMPVATGSRIKDDGAETRHYVELDRTVVVFDKQRQKYEFIFNLTNGLSKRIPSTKPEGVEATTNMQIKTEKQEAKKDVPVADWPKWELPELDGLLEEIWGQREKVFGSNDDTDDSPFELCATHNQGDGVLLITLEMGNDPKSKLEPLPGLNVHSRFSMEPRHVYNSVIMVDNENRTPKWLIDLLKEEHFIKTDKSSKADDNQVEVPEDQLALLKKKTALVAGDVILRDSLALLEAAEQYYYNNQLEKQGIPILLMMRMPKTITITIGQMLDLLNEKYRSEKRGIPSYWENLIVMNWEPPKTWRIARVHPAQKSLEEMHDILLKHGYEVPS